MSFSENPEITSTPKDIEAAAVRLAGRAVETPLLAWPAVDERLGGHILIKPEQLQRTGSFKFRGAYNKLTRLVDAEEGCHAVVAFLSGNHAQGVAAAAQLLGVSATIVIPADAPAMKTDNTRRYGARVVFYDRGRDDRDRGAFGCGGGC